MLTTGHHTCSSNGKYKGDAFNRSPFWGKHEEHKPNGEKKFLGSGYYFWDNNIELAKWWGVNHYSGKYIVISMEIEITESSCFDLVGNRTHMIEFTDFIERMESDGSIEKGTWSVSKGIELLKKARERTGKNYFPYKMIRAIDLTTTPGVHPFVSFVSGMGRANGSTNLNPKIIICIIKEDDLPRSTKKLVFSS